MKKLYLSSFILLSHVFLSAQTVMTISAGTNMFLSAGTIVSGGGLVLTPSSGFTLNAVSLTKTSTVSHSTANTYVSRVYQFSNTTPSFSGTIQFFYSDAELNGLNEANLVVNIHTGTSWQSVNSTTNDVTNNFVLTNAFVNKTLNEIALSAASSTLPLQWGNISAYRHARTVAIDWSTWQEYNVSHFTVERSIDARNWSIVADNIPATNTSMTHQYSITDNDYLNARLYYRIRQTDIDGRSTYSTVVVVTAENEINTLVVYPNPVTTGFYINNVAATSIRRVQLYGNSGLLIKAWDAALAFYNMQEMPAGVYHLRIDLEDGSHQYIKIIK